MSSHEVSDRSGRRHLRRKMHHDRRDRQGRRLLHPGVPAVHAPSGLGGAEPRGLVAGRGQGPAGDPEEGQCGSLRHPGPELLRPDARPCCAGSGQSGHPPRHPVVRPAHPEAVRLDHREGRRSGEAAHLHQQPHAHRLHRRQDPLAARRGARQLRQDEGVPLPQGLHPLPHDRRDHDRRIRRIRHGLL